MGLPVSQHGQLGAIPPPPFLSIFLLESMRSGGAIPPPPPHTKGASESAMLARYPMKTRQNACDTPLCNTISKGYCAIGGGISRTGPLSSQPMKSRTLSQRPKGKEGQGKPWLKRCLIVCLSQSICLNLHSVAIEVAIYRMGNRPDRKFPGKWERKWNRNGREMATEMEKWTRNGMAFFSISVAIFRPFRAWGHFPFSFPFSRDCVGPVSHSENGHFDSNLSGPLNRLNAVLYLLHPLDRFRTPSAIGSAI